MASWIIRLVSERFGCAVARVRYTAFSWPRQNCSIRVPRKGSLKLAKNAASRVPADEVVAVCQLHNPEPGLELLNQLAASIGVMVIFGLSVDIAVEQPEQGVRTESALSRDKPNEGPTRSQYPLDLLQRLIKVCYVLEHIAGNHHVVGVRDKRQRRIDGNLMKIEIHRCPWRAISTPTSLDLGFTVRTSCRYLPSPVP